MARVEACVSSYYPLVELIHKEGPNYLRKDWQAATGLANSTISRCLNKQTRYITWRTLWLMARAAGIDIDFAKHQHKVVQNKLRKKTKRPKLKLRKAS